MSNHRRVGSSPISRTTEKTVAIRRLFFYHRMGLEPEGSWQGAGGALQPEVASAAAEFKSHLPHHRKNSRHSAAVFLSSEGEPCFWKELPLKRAGSPATIGLSSSGRSRPEGPTRSAPGSPPHKRLTADGERTVTRICTAACGSAEGRREEGACIPGIHGIWAPTLFQNVLLFQPQMVH